MFFCCAGADARTDTVIVVSEPAIEPAPQDSAKQEEDRQRKAALKVKEEEDEQARRQKEAAEAAGSLPITFRDASGTKTYTVSFTTKPMGMDFDTNKAPLKVKKTFGAAKRLGVSDGSCIISVGGVDVEKLGYGEVVAVLKEKVAPLTPDGLTIDFKDTSGQLRPIIFPTKPLGIDFNNGTKPVGIKSVKETAQNLGVEAQWVFASIDGTNVETMEFDQMLVLLRSKIEKLPTKD